MGGVVAQWVEHGVLRPSDAGSSPRCGKGFQSPVPVQTLTVSAQPPCTMAAISICVHVKNPKHWHPYHRLDTQKHSTH